MHLKNSIFKNYFSNYKQWDFFVFSVLTILSILYGQITVFYLIYFFWWYEVIRIVVDSLCFKKNPNAVIDSEQNTFNFGMLFQMGIYFVFIVVFFGLMANWENKNIMIINFEILWFQNWFFNLNLLFVLFERVYIHKAKLPVKVSFGSFTPNMIVLHVAIILGALILFFIVKNYPEIFTPNNLWGSVLIVMPFLLLKRLVQYFSSDNQKIKHT